MPTITLPDVYGKLVEVHSFTAPVVVICVLCGHCPYVLAIEDRLLTLAKSYTNEHVQFVGICANDAARYPDDSPEALRERVETKGYPFPYLIDESQTVARALDAVCTPEFFVYNNHRKLVYHGRLDDGKLDANAVTRQELKEAIDATLAGVELTAKQYPSVGCSIKWKM